MATPSRVKSDIILEFLEVAFNSVLYHRNVYPASIFTHKKKYSVPVYLAAHPRVVKYITECLKTIKTLLEWNSIHHIELIIFSNDKPIEKHVFQLINSDSVKDEYFVATEEAFRAYLLKLSGSVRNLSKLSDDCNFSIELTTTEQASVRLSDSVNQINFPWLETERNITSDSKLLPLKTIKTDNVALEMFLILL